MLVALTFSSAEAQFGNPALRGPAMRQAAAPRVQRALPSPRVSQPAAPTRSAPCRSGRPTHYQAAPTRACNSGVNRPTLTAGGVPVRYVDVPIPAYGGYGYNSYYYPGGGGGYAAPLEPNSSYQRSAPRVQTEREALPPDPRSARNNTYRKLLEDFSRENSLGGRLYLKEGSESWLLELVGRAEYTDSRIIVPCLGKTKDGYDRPVLLTLEVYGDQIVDSRIQLYPRT